MIEFMEQPVDNLAGDSATTQSVPPEQDDVADLVRCIVKAADGRKAEDIVALRVAHVSTLTTFLVILSGNSRPQNQAIAAAITKDVAEKYHMTPGGTGVPEGSPESGWMVLDYGSVMVHIMTPKSRLYYNVEGQWRDKGGEAMDLSDILIPNSAVLGDSSSPNNNNGSEALRAEDDPFWS
jgi:ribosome-associated protein